MQKEKKLKANQKIALERIYRLFALAEENEEYAKRYVGLAKRIGEKVRVSIPKELKQKYCTKCHSLKVMQTKAEPFLIIKCGECGFSRKYGIKEKKPRKKQEPKQAKKKHPKKFLGASQAL